MLLTFLAAFAADDPSSALTRLMSAASHGEEPETWFDAQAWLSAEFALATQRQGWRVWANSGGDGERTSLEPVEIEMLDGGVSPDEWSRVRAAGAGGVRAFLAAARCTAGPVTAEHVASAHPTDVSLYLWPERANLSRLVWVRLVCATPQVWVEQGGVALPFRVEAVVLTESAAGWRIAGVVTDRTGDLWEAAAADVEVDVVAAENARRARFEALAASETPTITHWSPPRLPKRRAVPERDLDDSGKLDVVLPRLGAGVVGVVIDGELRRVTQAFPSEGFGALATVAGDVDGDGFADLVVSAPGQWERGVASVPGSIWVFPGGRGLDLARPSRVEAPDPADAGFGDRVVAPGDINGDGRADLAVAGPRAGEVYVYFGGALEVPGAVIRLAVLRDPRPDPDPDAGGRMALWALASAADVDGDGFADLWLRVHVADRERAFLVHGGPTARIEHVGALAGFWPATAADLDGDGRAELVAVDDEQVVVYASGPAGWTPRWSAPAPVCRAAVAADFDGDGRSEIALGCPGANRGRGEVRIYSAAGRELARIAGAAAREGFGHTVLAPGDVDGDGRTDLVVGRQDAAVLYTDPLTTTGSTLSWTAR